MKGATALPLLNTIKMPKINSTMITGSNHHLFRCFMYFQKSLKNPMVLRIITGSLNIFQNLRK